MQRRTFSIFNLVAIVCFIALSFISCSYDQAIPKTGNWETLECSGAPTGRHENGFVESGGNFYLFGGRGIKPVEVFNPETNVWEHRLPTPFEMHHFQAVTIGDTIYVIGCMTGPYPTESPVENVYMYVPKTDAWIKGPEIPEHRRRGSAGAVVYDGKIYVVAGIQLGHTSGTVAWFDVFDPKTGEWTELADAPNIRDHFHAVVIGNKLYCVGGRNTSYHTDDNFAAFLSAPVQEADCYDFAAKTWSSLEIKLPVGTAAGGIAAIDNIIYYFGGESGQQSAHSETQCLDLATGAWSFAAPMNRGRHGSAAINFGGALYIAAGSGNKGGGPELTSIEKYTPNSEWISIFNGSNLDGWQVKCLPQDGAKTFWFVENGAITCNSMEDKDHNYVWLLSENEYDNFELSLQVKAFKDSPGNSGVQIRSRYDESADAPNGGWLNGPQVDIHPPAPFRTGLIYDETRGEQRWLYPSKENWEIEPEDAPHEWTFKYAEEGWNDLTIICNGTHIKTILNGHVVTDWDGAGVLDNEAHQKFNIEKSGHIALQLHANDALKIQFKNIKIQQL